jgi:hypothetical protein
MACTAAGGQAVRIACALSVIAWPGAAEEHGFDKKRAVSCEAARFY